MYLDPRVYATTPFVFSRVQKMDGTIIHTFGYDEQHKDDRYFRKWIDENLFNLEKTIKNGNEFIYIVS